MSAIHQFLPLLAPGDGTGNNARAIATRCQELGIDSNFFTQVDRTGLAAARFDEYHRYMKPDDVVIYHLATWSPVAQYLKRLNQQLAVYYHNVTPGDFFAPYSPGASVTQRLASLELEALAERAFMAMTPSAYNTIDLHQAGYALVHQIPIIFDPEDFTGEGDPKVDKLLADLHAEGTQSWLFVGRLVPNKAQEHLIMALHAHRRALGGNAVLHLIGRPAFDGYLTRLRKLAADLGVAEKVNFVSGASTAELASYYRGSDVFASASEHEGFCMPIVEAMFHGLPTVAYEAAAVGETLGRAGVLLAEHDPLAMAVWLDKLATDKDARSAFRGEAVKQLERLSPVNTIPMLDGLIAMMLEAGGSGFTPDFDHPSRLAEDSRRIIDALAERS